MNQNEIAQIDDLNDEDDDGDEDGNDSDDENCGTDTEEANDISNCSYNSGNRIANPVKKQTNTLIQSSVNTSANSSDTPSPKDHNWQGCGAESYTTLATSHGNMAFYSNYSQYPNGQQILHNSFKDQGNEFLTSLAYQSAIKAAYNYENRPAQHIQSYAM